MITLLSRQGSGRRQQQYDRYCRGGQAGSS